MIDRSIALGDTMHNLTMGYLSTQTSNKLNSNIYQPAFSVVVTLLLRVARLTNLCARFLLHRFCHHRTSLLPSQHFSVPFRHSVDGLSGHLILPSYFCLVLSYMHVPLYPRLSYYQYGIRGCC